MGWSKIRRARRAPRGQHAARVPVWRLALGTLISVLGIQAAVLAVLSVVALKRQRRSTLAFPHSKPVSVSVGANALRIYTYGRDLYDAMIEAIDSARETIYFETFIWKDDAVGRRFKEHLAKKAAEGVKVYVIFDTFGNLVVPHAFKQFPSAVHKLQYQAMKRPWHLLDPRHYALDHRKLLVVDGRIGFIGGYNIGSLYATQWRDTHLRIIGPAARELGASFVYMWNRIAPKRERFDPRYRREFEPSIQVRGNDSLRLTFPIRDMYIDAIDRAQHHIYLTNAYFVPDHILLDALKSAAQRGVDVRVLVPWQSNHILADWVSRSYFMECLEAGMRIFAYNDVMIHAKTCTIDTQWSTIGTANLDRLSAVGNYEINVEVYSDELAREMEVVFEQDLTNAREITAERWRCRPWYVKLSERILAPLRVAV